MSARRDVSLLLQKIRDICQSRKNVNFLRFRDDLSPRTQPPPNLPPGPNAKLNGNYYYTRDARRMVQPTEVFVEAGPLKKLPEGGAKPVARAVERVPGKTYHWDM